MYMQILTWALLIISTIGVIYNARRKVSGFYFWIVANMGWVYINIQQNSPAEAFLFVFYTIMCFHGIREQKRKDKEVRGGFITIKTTSDYVYCPICDKLCCLLFEGPQTRVTDPCAHFVKVDETRKDYEWFFLEERSPKNA